MNASGVQRAVRSISFLMPGRLKTRLTPGIFLMASPMAPRRSNVSGAKTLSAFATTRIISSLPKIFLNWR